MTRRTSYLLALSVFAADRATKHLIETRVSPWETYEVIPGVFNIVHTQNRGAAFGMMADSSSEWRSLLLVGVSLGVIGLLAVLLWQPSRAGFPPSRLLPIGLSLIFGGALGNVYDRILVGSVTDFLQVFLGSYEWPSFNVADSAISVGAGLILLDLWRTRHDPARPPGVR